MRSTGDCYYMLKFVATAGAVCLCSLFVQTGAAQAGRLDQPSAHLSGSVQPRGIDASATDKTATGSVGDRKTAGKSAKKNTDGTKREARATKRDGKRGRETIVNRDGTVLKSRIKNNVRTTAYPKAEKPTGFTGLIHSYAAAYGVPPALAHAVVRIESNFNPKARGRAGEIGLMQIKPTTARMMGYKGSSKGLYDPETNIKYGMKYLALAHQLGGGTTCGTILKYNAGHGAKRMNPVSKRYCGKVQNIIN